MAGYECKFVYPLPEILECPFCHRALRNPVQAECGHRYCKDCVESILQKPRPICPLDNEEIFQIFPDNACRREILNLDVHCTFTPSGCDWVGKLKELEVHVKSCDYRDVQCTLCGQHIQLLYLSAHDERECPMRPQQCTDKYFVDKVTTQAMQPFGENILCPNSGTIKVPIFPHPLLESSLGSMHHSQLKAYLQPFQQNTSVPVGFDSEENYTINDEGVKDADMDLQQLMSGLEETVQHQRHKIKSLEDEMLRLKTQLTQLSIEGQEAAARYTGSSGGYFSSTYSPQISASTQLQQDVESLSDQMSKLECSIDQRFMQLELPTYNGIFVWKIPEICRCRRQAMDGRVLSLYSPPFYTSQHGYKMCARVYLNGDSTGKGTHLSFFFVVMRGPFDALLTWPFKQKVTLSLINQSGKKHVTDTFRPDPQSSSFQRPGKEEMNVASGCPMFIRIEYLLNGGFINDDSIFLKVVVDTSDLPNIVP